MSSSNYGFRIRGLGLLLGVALGVVAQTVGAEVPNTAAARALAAEAAGSFIFVLDPTVPSDRVPEIARAMVAQHGAVPRHVFTTVIRGFSASMSPAAAAELAARNPSVRYYEPNGIAWAVESRSNAAKNPNGGGGGKPGSGSNEPPQVVPPGILRVGGPLNAAGTDAWVIDTGIDLNHPDLSVGKGVTFVSEFGRPTADDKNGHGTHVAGIIAALDNGIDVVGVAAGATVHPVRVLDANGSGTVDAVVAGVDYVAQNAASGDVANMSLAAQGHFQSLHDAVVNAANLGIKFAIAAANDRNYAGYYEPAHIDHPNVYTVSAVDANDFFAWFSNYGNPPVDFAAPGVNVLSTQAGGGVVSYSGTSMAAPHVAGLLLLGVPVANGYAINDPDGNPDPIAHH